MKNVTGMIATVIILALGSQADPAPPKGTGSDRNARNPYISETQEGTPANGENRVSKIIGIMVSDEKNVPLGRIRDLIFDTNGHIIYLVIARGDSEKLCAVPSQSLSSKVHAGNSASISISKEQFDKAPDFGDWAEFSSEGYKDKVHAYYGTGPAKEGRSEWDMKMDHALEKIPQ